MRSVCRSVCALVLIALCVLSVGGCSSGTSETLYPVTGKILHKGTELKAGMVTFVPDEAKGNKSKSSPGGQIGPDGTYTLTTAGRPGAPAGWYRVTVNTEVPGMGMTTPDPNRPGVSLGSGMPVQIDPKYKDVSKTDLLYEVVASPAPGAYDLKLLR
jgi:hypothetical protein